MYNLKGLFKDKDKLIDALNSKFEANIDASQKKLFKAFSEGLIDKLQLDENKQVVNNQYNRNLLLSADKLFAEYTKQNSPAIIKELLNGVSSIMDFNNKFYSNFTEKAKLLPIKESVLSSLKGWLGIEDNAIKSNGYLDTLVKSDSVKNQIKNTVLKTVYGQEGWDATKKSLAKMIEGDKENLGALQKYHRNFAYDLYSQIDRATGKAYADDLGFEFAIYEGGIIETSREFCKEHNGNVYHKSEIADFDPKVAKQPDYNSFTDLGGFGCRHHLNWVPTALALVMRPDARKFLDNAAEAPKEGETIEIPKELEKIGLTKEVLSKMNKDGFDSLEDYHKFAIENGLDTSFGSFYDQINKWTGFSGSILQRAETDASRMAFDHLLNNNVTKDNVVYRGATFFQSLAEANLENIYKIGTKINFGQKFDAFNQGERLLKYTSYSSDIEIAKRFARGWDDERAKLGYKVILKVINDKGVKGLRIGDLHHLKEQETIVGGDLDYQVLDIKYSGPNNNDVMITLKQL